MLPSMTSSENLTLLGLTARGERFYGQTSDNNRPYIGALCQFFTFELALVTRRATQATGPGLQKPLVVSEARWQDEMHGILHIGEP